jgi:hypothetical protein
MDLPLRFARSQVGATCILAFAILAACTSSSPSGDDPDAGNGGFPHCTATERCVGYPSFGDWVCLRVVAAPVPEIALSVGRARA